MLYPLQLNSKKNFKTDPSFSVFHKEEIQQPWEYIDQILINKKKILDSIKTGNEVFLIKQNEFDLKINELNKRVLSLRFAIAKKVRGLTENMVKRKILALKARITFLKKDNERKVEEVSRMDSRLKGILELKSGNGGGGKETMAKERERVVGEMKEKEREVEEARQDLKDFMKIFDGMNEIFFSFQEKMYEQMKEINDLNINYIELTLDREDLELLDEVFKETYSQAGSSKLLKDKLKKKFIKHRELYKSIQDFPNKTNQILANLSKLDNFIEDILDEKEVEKILIESKENISSLLKSLEIPLQKPIKIQEIPERSSKSQRNLNISLNSTLRSLESSINSLSTNEILQNLQLNLNNLKNQDVQFKITQENLINSLESLKQNSQELNSQIKSLVGYSHALDLQIKKLKLKETSTENLIVVAQDSKKNDLNLQEELKSELASLERKLNRHKVNLDIIATPTESKKMRSIMNQMTVLHEELFKKDSSLLQKSFQLLQSTRSIKKTSKSLQSLDLKSESLKQEVLSKVQDQLDSKSREIEMLKEIIRDNASEIRTKEAKVLHLRKQFESSLNSHNSVKIVNKK